MARLTMKINGKRGINWHVARHVDVSRAMQRNTFEVGRKAEAVLAGHKHDGHARIEVNRGDVDWYVTLSDERGLNAAMSIEYGREPGRRRTRDGREWDDPGMAPVAPLRAAVNLA